MKPEDVNLQDNCILIYRKGSKEWKLQIGSKDVVYILQKHKNSYLAEIQAAITSLQTRTKHLSDQSVCGTINRYTSLTFIELHITPHMFRHTFTTNLLEADVDIRYIQKMLVIVQSMSQKSIPMSPWQSNRIF